MKEIFPAYKISFTLEARFPTATTRDILRSADLSTEIEIRGYGASETYIRKDLPPCSFVIYRITFASHKQDEGEEGKVSSLTWNRNVKKKTFLQTIRNNEIKTQSAAVYHLIAKQIHK